MTKKCVENVHRRNGPVCCTGKSYRRKQYCRKTCDIKFETLKISKKNYGKYENFIVYTQFQYKIEGAHIVP